MAIKYDSSVNVLGSILRLAAIGPTTANGKIDALLASGYDPKLDDGVGKNIAPLQKAGLMSYEVLNSG